MTCKELEQFGITSRLARSPKGYQRAVANAAKQFLVEDYGSAELFTQESFVFTEIGNKNISLSIMTREADCTAVEAEAFRARIISLVPHFVAQILREEKRHSKTNA